MGAWAKTSILEFGDRLGQNVSLDSIQETQRSFEDRFEKAFLSDVDKVLVWLSGKDLFAALRNWLESKSVPNPGEFRASLRDWVIEHPGRTLELLPEWQGLIQVIQAAS